MSQQLISKSSFGAACVLSALGSLPLHVMPIVVAAAMQVEKVTLAQAGLISGVFSFGQLFAAITLPLLVVQSISWFFATIACVLLVLLLLLNADSGMIIFFIAWGLIGACAGVLSYLGITAAASVEDKSNSFTTRMGVTLLIAGCTMLAFFSFGSSPDYSEIMIKLGVASAVLALGGLIYYRKPLSRSGTSTISRRGELDDNHNSRIGLFFLFLFIAAQIGFIVFAVDSATRRGIDVAEATMAIAMCKIVAAILLLASTNDSKIIPNPVTGNLVLPIILLATGIYLISNTASVLLFLLGFLLWESAVNFLSAGFQAGVVMISPSRGSMLLGCVILLGAVVGPVLHSLAAAIDLQDYFVYFVLLSVALPLVWNRQLLMSERVKAEFL